MPVEANRPSDQILIIMIGHPGSGKSYFTKQLAPLIHAVRFNADHMRIMMFDDPEEARNRDNNPMVFGAIDYAVHETLKAGYSVICDVQRNKVSDRRRSEAIAAEFNVPTVLVWIKTPFDVALKRGQERPETLDQRRKSEEHMTRSIERFMKALEEPEANEKCITIDGTVPFVEQLRSFQEQLRDLIA